MLFEFDRDGHGNVRRIIGMLGTGRRLGSFKNDGLFLDTSRSFDRSRLFLSPTTVIVSATV